MKVQYEKLIIALMACYDGLQEGLEAHDGQSCTCREELYDQVMAKACDLTLDLFPDAKGEHIHRGLTLFFAGVYKPARTTLIILQETEGFDEYKMFIEKVNNSPISEFLQILKKLMK